MKILLSLMTGPARLGRLAAWLVACLGLPGLCSSQTYNGFSYSVSGTAITITGFNISGYSPPGGAVAIPSTIPGVNGTVTAIGNSAFEASSGLTSVTIPNGVTSIGGDAFFLSTLTSVAIPASVTSIGQDAFAYGMHLTSITVDAQNAAYSSVGGVLFDKSQRTLIAYPGGAAGAYTIPSGVTTIQDSAFFECSGLTSVAIPGGVTSIGNDAFNSSGLRSVTIANGVASIGYGAFSSCHGLTSVSIPGSVTFIGAGAFGYCSQLTAITVDTQNSAYSSVGGVLFDKSQRTLVAYAGGAAYTIPSGVTSIGEDAFIGLGLGSVTIPNTVTSIGGAAFGYCNLATLTIPNSVTSIGTYAFTGCPELYVAYFQGNAPASFGVGVFSGDATDFGIFYPADATGFTTPTWNGYPAFPYGGGTVGGLEVTLAPAGAVSAGAQWQVDGGAWQNSGATVFGLAAGTHTVAYNTVTGWTTPSSQNVTITANNTTTANGVYGAQVPAVSRMLGSNGFRPASREQ